MGIFFSFFCLKSSAWPLMVSPSAYVAAPLSARYLPHHHHMPPMSTLLTIHTAVAILGPLDFLEPLSFPKKFYLFLEFFPCFTWSLAPYLFFKAHFKSPPPQGSYLFSRLLLLPYGSSSHRHLCILLLLHFLSLESYRYAYPPFLTGRL